MDFAVMEHTQRPDRADRPNIQRAKPGFRAAGPAGVLALQQLAGNAAVAGWLTASQSRRSVGVAVPEDQPVVLEESSPAQPPHGQLDGIDSMGGSVLQRTIGDGHDLSNVRFVRDPVLEGCFDNERTVKIGASGPAVTKLQQAMVDIGLSLPAFGVDGKFGPETKSRIQAFQRSAGIRDDGIVGPITMGEFDRRIPGGGTPPPTPPAPAAETITSETVLTSPGARTRKTIGVGEEVRLTHAPGVAAWATTAGTLSAANGVTVTLTAPDTAQQVTVTGGGTTIIFDVLAPTDVHMDPFGGTGVKHTKDHADSGIETQPFLLPDTVNFRNVVYHELNVAAVVTTPGAYSCFAGGTGHCLQPAGGVCPDLAMTDTVVAGKGTQAVLGDCVYSGDCQQGAPFVPGSITFPMGYEYKVGAGPFRNIRTVDQQSNLAADGVTLTSSKAGADGQTTVASPTVAIAACP